MQFLSMTISWRRISQGRVATRLKCGGIFNYYVYCKFISESNSRKKFWKSVKISQNYRHESGGPVFLEHSVHVDRQKPNSITPLAGSELVRSWFESGSELAGTR